MTIDPMQPAFGPANIDRRAVGFENSRHFNDKRPGRRLSI
jgi:hypothetical protein